MPEISSGLRSILTSPFVYRAWGILLGGPAATAEHVSRYLRPEPGDRVLDIGCGPADMLAQLPDDVAYVGFDVSASYIEAARLRYGKRGTFIHASVGEPPPVEPASFDIANATGLLHHLSDEEALGTLRLAYDSLKPNGRLITLDPPLGVEGQSRIARWLIEHDRGQNVRKPEQYLSLARNVFASVNAEIRHNPLNVPYTYFIMECRKT